MGEHIQRKSEEKLTVYEHLPQGIRSFGKPRARWKDHLHKDMLKIGLEEEDVRDRETWRRVVGEAK